MISKMDKNADRVVRHARVRKKVSGTHERPRFDVYRSNQHIYAQIIDDLDGKTYEEITANGNEMPDDYFVIS